MKPTLRDISIGPEHIGHAIRERVLYVPPNQREYSWRSKHVTALLSDLENVIEGNGQEYFLGSIVVTESENDKPRVVDGQQRLATTLLLLAAIRDRLEKVNPGEAHKIHTMYIVSPVLGGADEAHLNLSDKDRQYFMERVLLFPGDQTRRAAEAIHPTVPSHVLIDKAAKLAK